jgi:peptidoglycan/xylan/chitin deacetylase (PgdA/CDA1 family)
MTILPDRLPTRCVYTYIIAALCSISATGVWCSDGCTTVSLAEGLSHLGPRLHASRLSQLAAHTGIRPPSALAAPLAPGNGDIIKGYSAAWESRLAAGLLAADLRHDILRVAVGSYKDSVMALVKLQAAERRDGRFDLMALEQDAVTALSIAFNQSPRMQSVDVWAVVPQADNAEYEHLPVFSISVTRDQFFRVTAQPRVATDVLARLGLIRLHPTYLKHVSPGVVFPLRSPLPVAVYDMPAMRAAWSERLEQCRVRLAESESMQVAMLEGVGGDHEVAALTIDDGPHPLTTPLMLSVLHDYGVRATFFLVGEKAEEYPELVARIARGGHEIANHSYTHRRAQQLTGPEILAEIEACREVLHRITGMDPTLFRPPGGRVGCAGLQALAASRHTLLMWTNNADDWLRPAPETIAANALERLEPGGIILMHQGSMESLLALPLIIEGAANKGIKLGTASEMLEAGAGRILQMEPTEAEIHLTQNGYACE